MAAEPSAPVGTCPPHYWLIDNTQGRQRWACQQCGLVRAEKQRPLEARRLANQCTWSRDEVALLDVELD